VPVGEKFAFRRSTSGIVVRTREVDDRRDHGAVTQTNNQSSTTNQAINQTSGGGIVIGGGAQNAQNDSNTNLKQLPDRRFRSERELRDLCPALRLRRADARHRAGERDDGQESQEGPQGQALSQGDHPHPHGGWLTAASPTAGLTRRAGEDAYEQGFEDTPRRYPDISKIERAVGWTPTRTLDEILCACCALPIARPSRLVLPLQERARPA